MGTVTGKMTTCRPSATLLSVATSLTVASTSPTRPMSSSLTPEISALLRPVTVADAIAIGEAWIDNQFQSDIITSNSEYTHASIMTAFWGFPDDFFFKAVCDEETNEV